MIGHNNTTMLLKRFVDGMVKASGAAGQMVHQHEDVRWMPLFNKLCMIRDKTIKIAMKATGVEVKHGQPK
jgi:hypothetical protein